MPQQDMENRTAAENGRRDKSSRKGVGWTVIDTAILLLVVAAIIGVVYRAIDFFGQKPYDTEYYVCFVGVEPLPDVDSNRIQGNEVVYDHQTGVRLGYVQAEHMTYEASPEERRVTFSGYITVDEGVLEEDGSLSILNGRASLTPGDRITICTDRVAMLVRIESIQAQEPATAVDTAGDETDGVIETERTVETDENTEAVIETETEPMTEEAEGTTAPETVTLPTVGDLPILPNETEITGTETEETEFSTD